MKVHKLKEILQNYNDDATIVVDVLGSVRDSQLVEVVGFGIQEVAGVWESARKPAFFLGTIAKMRADEKRGVH